MTQQSNSYNTFDESKWWFDYKQEKQSDYSYWYTSEKIDAQVALRNLPDGWLKIKCWQTTISTTGTLSITWVGFQPKFIRFQAVDWNRTWSNCDIDSFSWSHNWLRMWKISWALQFDTTTMAAELYRDSGGTYVTVDFSSFDTDGFTINRLVVWFSATLQWTCMW